MANNPVFDPASAVFTPPEFARVTLDWLQSAKDQRGEGLALGIEGLDGYFAKMPAGRVCMVLGQTSHYKSGLLKFVEHNAALQLTASERPNQILVHISVEDLVEEQGESEVARYSGETPRNLAEGRIMDWGKVHQAIKIIGTVPVYRIGESMARPEAMPYLSITNMKLAVDYLLSHVVNFPAKIAGLYFDYLQAFPADQAFGRNNVDQQRRLQVRHDFYTIREMAVKYGCPAFVAVQAKQELKGAHPPLMIPGMYDGEETSALAQRADRILSVWLPARTCTLGTVLDFGPLSVKVTDDLLIIKVVKQRGNLPAGKIFICRVDFETNTIRNVSDELMSEFEGLITRNRAGASSAAHPAHPAFRG